MTQDESTPWYRQFWPWMIIGILGWGVVSSAITLTVAVRNPPQMVDGDYAELGKLLVDTHERADRARQLGLNGTLSFARDRWRLDLGSSAAAGELDETLLLLIRHPVDSARDRQVLLRREAEGRYTAAAAPVPARGRLIVSDPAQSWWISGAFGTGEGGGNGEFAVALRPERL
ncbi:MAG: FixH family protein [Wenzhouxiangellaceae bacterium]|nr:FixH family protein [Wenzhouxiangellaceae bacterium]